MVRFVSITFLIALVFGVCGMLSARADECNIAVGPASFHLNEGSANKILVQDYNGHFWLMVDPKSNVFTGLTMKLGLEFSTEDFNKVWALTTGANTTITIRKISDDNLGKSWVEADFKRKNLDGTSTAVKVYPAATGQKTSGTVKVKKTKSGDTSYWNFTFDLDVTKLVIEQYNKRGVKISTKTPAASKNFKGTCKTKAIALY